VAPPVINILLLLSFMLLIVYDKAIGLLR